MAFSDPQSVTINAVPISLPSISVLGTKTIYQSSDEAEKLTLSHQESSSRVRRMARLDSKVIAADPLTSNNEYKECGVYLVIDQPRFGFTDAQIDYRVQALSAWLTTANVLKLLGNEH